MKFTSLIVAIALSCCIYPSYAQPEAGKVLVGGSSAFSFQSSKSKLKFNQSSQDGERTSTIQFLPQIGYMFTDNLAAGLELGYTYAGDGDVNSSAFAVGPFLRYYFDTGSPTVYPFLYGAVGIGSEKISDDEDDLTTNFTAYGFGAGIAVFLNERVSLDFGASYVSKNSGMKDFEDLKFIQNNVVISVGFAFFL